MTDRYAVIGNPIQHSKSPEIHAMFARQFGHVMTYVRLLAPLGGFHAKVDAFRRAGAAGVNVTLPFKVEAFDYATSASARSLAAGAANTLHFLGDEIVADNTDGAGLVRDITRNLQHPITSRHILLLGAGGAARGVIGALLAENPASLSITNRTIEKASALLAPLADTTMAPISVVKMEDIGARKFDIVINATSASIQNSALEIPSGIFAPASLAYDMMYGMGNTEFMGAALKQGAAAHDGLGMLVEQAAEAFYVWRGVRPETATVIAAMRAEISTEMGKTAKSA